MSLVKCINNEVERTLCQAPSHHGKPSGQFGSEGTLCKLPPRLPQLPGRAGERYSFRKHHLPLSLLLGGRAFHADDPHSSRMEAKATRHGKVFPTPELFTHYRIGRNDFPENTGSRNGLATRAGRVHPSRSSKDASTFPQRSDQTHSLRSVVKAPDLTGVFRKRDSKQFTEGTSTLQHTEPLCVTSRSCCRQPR